MGDIAGYWDRGFHQVEGWVEAGLLPYLKQVADLQDHWNVSGNVGEIGVHHGRLFIALAHLARDHERCVAIDIFSDQDKNIDGSGVGDLDQLKRNVATHAPSEGMTDFIQADTLALTLIDRQEIARRFGPFRLFSVDGGHTVEHVVNDLLFVQDMLSDGGVILADDYMNRYWPGVTEGICRFYERYSPRVKPFLLAHNKLFFASLSSQRKYFETFREALKTVQSSRVVRMFDCEVIVV